MVRRGSESSPRLGSQAFRLKPLTRSVQLALLPGLAFGLQPFAAQAAPTGGHVQAGAATIVQNAPAGLTTIQQQSQRAAIDWQSFDVARHETVQFNQPNARASVLNRIGGQSPSQIFGQVKANGQVVLMNPNGVFFKPGAQVNVGSLVAGAMQIGIDDFMRGNYRLDALRGKDGRVVNQGHLEAAPGGDVTLVGQSVANEGVIVATAGRVNLVAGEQVTVDFDGDGLLRFAVDKAVVENAQVLDDQVANTGQILAEGGDVLITASAAENVFKNAINNQGVIKAGRIEKAGGKVMLVGLGPGASVLNTGQVDVSAATSTDDGGSIDVAAARVTNNGVLRADSIGGQGGKVTLAAGTANEQGQGARISAVSRQGGSGGHVEVTGDTVALNYDAGIDVSGAKGGGTALVGGDFRGGNAAVRNAQTTFVSSSATIKADATEDGDGGKVVVWANDAAHFHGTISAKGGAQGGDGGTVEVSGKEKLAFRGGVDTTAAHGRTGSLLLDPATLTIIDADDATGDLDGEIGGADVQILAGDGDIGTNTLSWGAIDALAITSDIVLEALGLITIEDVTGVAATTLNNLVELGLTTGSLTITSTTGDVVFADQNDVIRTEGGAITINAATNATLGGFDTTGAGGALSDTVTLNVGGSGSFGDVNTGGAVLTVLTGGTMTQFAGSEIAGGTAVTKTGTGTLVLGEANTYTGVTTVTNGTIEVTDDAGLGTDAAGTTVANGATLTINDVDIGNEALTITGAGVGGAGALQGTGANARAQGAIDATTATLGGTGTLRLDGLLTTTTALAKTGSGTVELRADNSTTITGAGATISIDDGILRVTDAAALGTTAAGTTVTAGKLEFALSSADTVAENLSLSGDGPGVSEALLNSSANKLTLSGTIALPATAVVGVSNAGGEIELTGVVSGAGGLTKSGTGRLTVTNGANAYTGATTVSAGTLVAGAADVFNTSSDMVVDGTLNLNGFNQSIVQLNGSGTVTNTSGGTGTNTLTVTGAGGVFNGKLTDGTSAGTDGSNDTLTFTMSGAGVQTLTGATSDYNGATGITAGATLRVTRPQGLGTTVGGTIVNGGTLELNVDSATDGNVVEALSFVTTAGVLLASNTAGTVVTGGVTMSTGVTITVDDGASAGLLTISGNLSGAGTLTKNGPGALTLSGTGNTQSGQTLVQAGTLRLTHQGALGTAGGGVAVNGTTVSTDARLEFAIATAQTVAEQLSLQGDGPGASEALLHSSANKLTLSGTIALPAVAVVNVANAAGEIDMTGALSGAGGVTKAGSGLLTLTGNNVYTGATGINAGTLRAGSNTAIGDNSAVTLAGTATLDLNGRSETVGSLNGAAGTTLALGAGGDLAAAGNIDLTGIVVTSTGGDNTLDSTAGTLTLDAYTKTDSGNLSLGGATSIVLNGDVEVQSGDLILLDNITTADDLTASSDITFSGTGTSNFTAAGAQTVTATAGNITDTSGAILAKSDGTNLILVAGTTIGVDATNRLGLAISGGGAVQSTIASTGSGNLFMESAIDLTVADLTTGAGANTVNISTVTAAGANLTMAGPYTNVAGDIFQLSARGSLNFTTTPLTVTTLATAISQGAAGAINLDVIVAGTTSFTINGGAAGASTIDAAGLAGNLAFAATGVGTGAVSGGLTVTSYSGIENIVGGSGTDTFSGNTAYVVTGTDTGTASSLTGGTWSNIENITGTAAADTFTFNAGSVLSGDASGLAGNDGFTLAGNAQVGTLFGGADQDGWNLAGFVLTGTIVGGTETDTIAASNNYTVTGANLGTSTNVTGGWSEIENLNGTTGVDTWTFQAGSSLSGTANLTQLGGNDIFNVTGSATVGELRGGGDDDTFSISSGAVLTGNVTGGDGTDTISIASGAVLAGNVTGGNGTDTLIFDGTARMVGIADGEGGSDTINFSTSTLRQQFTNGQNGEFTGLLGDPKLIDNSGGNDWTSWALIANGLGTTVGPNTDQFWLITGTDTARRDASLAVLAGGGGTVINGIVNIAAGTGIDIFIFETDGRIAGGIDGGAGVNVLMGSIGADLFTVTGGAALTLTVDVGGNALDTPLSAIANLDSTAGSAEVTFTDAGNNSFNLNGNSWAGAINGGAGTNSLVGATSYTINLPDAGASGNVTGGWSNIANLTGTGGIDTFTFSGTGALSGTADGLAGNDVFNVNAAASLLSLLGGAGNDTVTIAAGITLATDIDGGADNDTLVLTNAASALTGTYGGGTGGTDSDTVTGSSSYAITGADSGTATGISVAWTEVENLTGTTGGDTFTVNGGTLSGTANGLGGTDTLVGNTTHIVSGANSGTAGAVANWSAIENLTGTAGQDTFTVTTGTLSGTVDGLADTDTLAGNTSYTISAADGGTANAVVAWTGVENLGGTTGGDTFTVTTGSLSGTADGLGGSDTLAGNTTYDITSANAGAASAVAAWTAFENLSGTGGADSFTLNGGTLSGAVNGLGGSDTLIGSSTYGISGANAGTANGLGSWTAIENLTGTAGSDSFTVTSGSLSGTADGLGSNDLLIGNTSYTVDGVNLGTANAVANWVNIEAINGTAGADTFDFNAGSSLLAANGEAGNDTFNFNATTTITGAVLGGTGNDTFVIAAGVTLNGSVQGEADNDTLTLTDGTSILAGTFDGGSTGTDTDTLVGSTAYNVTGVDSGDASGVTAWTEVENLTGTGGADIFALNGGTLSGVIDGLGDVDVLRGSTSYLISGADAGTAAGVGSWARIENLDGTSGTDTFTVSGGSLSGTADGLGGADTLTGNTTYAITGVDSGASSSVAVWTAIENLSGTAAADTFTVNAGGALSGTADGLAGNDDFNINASAAIANVAGGAGDDDVVLAAGATLTSDIDGGADNDTLTFSDAAATLTGSFDGGATGTDVDAIVGSTAYNIMSADAGLLPGGATWTEVENLSGTGGDDVFAVNGGSLSGTVTGLAGNDELRGNSGYTITSADAGTASAVNAWTGIENLDGTAGDDTFTITGAGSLSGTADGTGGTDTLAGNTAYDITGVDAGTATAVAVWTDIDNLTGTTGSDTFTVNGGTLSGLADGLAGTDTLVGNTTHAITGANSGTAGAVANWTAIENLSGTGGDDTFTVSGAGTLSGTADGLVGMDTLTGNTSYAITGANAGSSSAVTTWTGIENLDGTAGADTFTVTGGSLIGTADGLGGSDLLTGDTAYTVTAANAGTSASLAAWTAIENLTGTAAGNVFVFAAASSLSGTASGLGGADTFTTQGGAISIGSLDGGIGNDTFNLQSATVLTANIVGGADNDTVNFGVPTGAPPGVDTSRVVGNFDLGAGSDTIDISGTAAVIGANLISGTFAGVNTLIGNGGSQLNGQNAVTFWRITGLNTGEFATSIADLGTAAAQTFLNFSILAGNQADTFFFAPGGRITGSGAGSAQLVSITSTVGGEQSGTIRLGTSIAGIDGGLGTNVVVGSSGSDVFTAIDATTVDLTVTGNTTRLAGITNIDSSLAGGSIAADTGADVFNLGSVRWGGFIKGGGGIDTLNVDGGVTASITAIAAGGMTSASNTVTGAGGFDQMEILNTGSGDDVISLTGAPPADTTGVNQLNLGGGTDSLNASFAVDWLITGDGAGQLRDPGNLAANVAFTGVDNLSSSVSALLTLPTSGPGASIAGVFSAPTVQLAPGNIFAGANGLRIGGVNGASAAVTSAGNLILNSAGGIDIDGSLNVAGSFSSTVSAGTAAFNAVTSAGPQNYSGPTTLRGNLTGSDLVFNGVTTIAGNVVMSSSTNIFNFLDNVLSGDGDVLSIVPTASNGKGVDLFIDTVGAGVPGHIAADKFAGFNGTLAIGGQFTPDPVTPEDVFAGTIDSATADHISVDEDLITSGDIVLIGSAVNFATGIEVAAGAPREGDIAVFALGNSVLPNNDGLVGGAGLGDVQGPTTPSMTFTGGRTLFTATSALLNSGNMIMNMGGGQVLVAQGAAAGSQQINFSVLSNASTSNAESALDQDIVISVAELAGFANNPAALFQNARVFFPNPAAILTILQEVSFVDSSLFEEDLSLFGVIGNGIALSLDQCEDAEGCAPSVTEEELKALVEKLNERISRLEGLVQSGQMPASEAEPLLAGYRKELQNFLAYEQELAAYNARQESDEFGDDSGDEFEDVFEAEEALDPVTDDLAPAEALPEEIPALEEAEEPFATIDAPVEEAAPIDEPAAADEDFEELDETVEPDAEEPEAAPAPDDSGEPAFEDSDDEFEELEEELDDSLLNQLLQPGHVNQLAGAVRVDGRGGVVWAGEVVLPSMHRRY